MICQEAEKMQTADFKVTDEKDGDIQATKNKEKLQYLPRCSCQALLTIYVFVFLLDLAEFICSPQSP